MYFSVMLNVFQHPFFHGPAARGWTLKQVQGDGMVMPE